MLTDITTKVIGGLILAGLTGLGAYLVKQVRKYKKLVKKEEDETVKATINNTLTEQLQPIHTDLTNIKKDVSNLQKFETNFQTRLEPVQEEIEHLKDDTTIILKQLENQGINVNNIQEKQELLEEKIRCDWRYRIRTLCHAYLKREYMTHEEFEQLQEMYALYRALGGNGQTKELYERTIALPIRAE